MENANSSSVKYFSNAKLNHLQNTHVIPHQERSECRQCIAISLSTVCTQRRVCYVNDPASQCICPKKARKLFFQQTRTTNPYFILISQRQYRTQTDKSVSQSKAIILRFVDYCSRLNEAGSLSKNMAVNYLEPVLF